MVCGLLIHCHRWLPMHSFKSQCGCVDCLSISFAAVTVSNLDIKYLCPKIYPTCRLCEKTFALKKDFREPSRILKLENRRQKLCFKREEVLFICLLIVRTPPSGHVDTFFTLYVMVWQSENLLCYLLGPVRKQLIE